MLWYYAICVDINAAGTQIIDTLLMKGSLGLSVEKQL
jgi:hypothetical protein